MTILQVQILLHYWCSDSQYPNMEAPTVESAHKYFVEKGILIKTDPINQPYYRINQEMAKPYIDQVTNIPLPVQVWAIPSYNIEKD